MTSTWSPRTTARAAHWIDGRPLVTPGEPLVAPAWDPVGGEPLREVPIAGPASVDAAVASASRAQQEWRDWAPRERGRALRRLAEAMVADAAWLADSERFEVGKTAGEMAGYVENAAEYFELYAGLIRAHHGAAIDLGTTDRAFTSYEPFGVVAAITPWNIPLSQAGRAVAPALAAGNAVVLKPSEFTPSTSLRLAELAVDVGIPAGVLNVVVGDGATGDALVRHPRVRLVAFTGSVNTGRSVARVAAERLIPAILELGGKSPNLVFADADLDAAVASIVGICPLAGQRCGALTRTLVHESVYDEVVERAAEGLRRVRPGKELPALTTAAQLDKVTGYFDIARADGARLVVGGKRFADGPGRYVAPTLLADVTPDMRVFREEIFGPIVTVTRFSTEAEAIELANDTDYGLVSNIWTADSSRALRVARAIEAGQVLVNGGRNGIDVPYGGYKQSGIGREKGFEALRQYSQLKSTVFAIRSA